MSFGKAGFLVKSKHQKRILNQLYPPFANEFQRCGRWDSSSMMIMKFNVGTLAKEIKMEGRDYFGA